MHAVREDYRRRYAQLVDNVQPLLERSSSGSTVDSDLQRAARAESRRLRALFDQATTFDHPLLLHLRPAVDAAEDRQVDVGVDINGELPDLTTDEISGVVAPLAEVLGASTASARIVLSCTEDEFSVSIVSQATSGSITLPEGWTRRSERVEVTTLDDTVWCLVRHPLHQVAHGNALVDGNVV